MMICKNCGCTISEPRYTEDDYRYCPFCGAKIAELLKEKGLTDEDVE
jgi:uncharacterized paraquat-inducible protein A